MQNYILVDKSRVRFRTALVLTPTQASAGADATPADITAVCPTCSRSRDLILRSSTASRYGRHHRAGRAEERHMGDQSTIIPEVFKKRLLQTIRA
jgi:hypothetical protein